MLATGFTFPKQGILIGIQVSPKNPSWRKTDTEEVSNRCLFSITSLWLKYISLQSSCKNYEIESYKHNGEVLAGAGTVLLPLDPGYFTGSCRNLLRDCYKLRAGIRELETTLLQRLVPVDDRCGQFIETNSFLHARQWDIFHIPKLDKI